MTNEFWQNQKSRLIDRFGERNFSREFSILVALECSQMPDDAFLSIVNAMIGSRKPNDPPLIRDFRDARLAYERREYERNLYGAARMMNEPARHVGLKAYLAKAFPGCKSINEAAEVRRLQIEIQKATDPNYDPLRDLNWTGES